MYIEKLELKNFRSHGNTSMNLARVNIVRGENGVGKSSIQMAIEFVLTGKCEITDAAGRGADDLISTGKRECVVGLRLSTGTLITRERGRSGGELVVADGKQSLSGKVAEAWIESHIAPTSVLSAVLNANRFLELNEKEQKALLAAALASDPVKVDPPVQKLLEFAGVAPHLAINMTFSTASAIDAEHKRWYDTRTEVNREIKALGSDSVPQVPDGYISSEKIREQLSGIQHDRDTLVSKRDKKGRDYDAAHAKWEGAQAQLAQAESFMLTEGQIKEFQKTSKNRSKAEKLDAEISTLKSEIQAKHAAITDWEKRPTNCETCGTTLNINPDELALKIETLTADARALSAELANKQVERTKLGDWETADRKLEEHHIYAQKYMSALTVNSEGEPTKLDTSEEDTKIAELEARIQKGTQVLTLAAQHEGAVQQHAKGEARRKELKDRLELIEQLVEAFGPNSPLRAKLVGSKLSDFRDRINQVLHQFGFECEFELEPYALSVIQLDDNGAMKIKPLKLNQLSESEQYRFSIAFQIAMAEATGVGFVVIDRVDMLTVAANQRLSQALLLSSLEQVIALKTTSELYVNPALQPDGVAYFNLKNEQGVTAVEVGYRGKTLEVAHAG